MEARKDISAAIKEGYLIIIWFIIIVAIRVFLLLSGRMAVQDDFGFFELVKNAEWKTAFTSGVAFAYEGTLSLFLRFTGDDMSFVAIYQTVMQTIALFLLLLGCRQLFGKGVAFLVGTLLGVSPWMMYSIFQVSPWNFYLFHWSVVLLLIGIFHKRTEVVGWFRSNAGEMYLIVTGFYMGVVCVWHYAGILLIFFVLYTQIKNASSLRERISIRQNILDMEEIMAEDEDDWWDNDWGEDPEKDELIVDSREYMPTLSQSGILVMGVFLGAYCTLMKYTGVTGNFIKEQMIWWLGLYRNPIEGKLWQDIPLIQLILLVGTMLAGVLLAMILNMIYRKQRLEAEILEAREYLKGNESSDSRKWTENISKEMSEEMPDLPELMPEDDWAREVPEEVDEPEPEEDWAEEVMEPESEEDWVEAESESEEETAVEPETESEPESQTKSELKPEDEFMLDSELEQQETESESSDVSQEEVKEPEKKVELIENPLPVPKRQVRPKVEFDVDDKDDDFDFDIDINSDDDFDI